MFKSNFKNINKPNKNFTIFSYKEQLQLHWDNTCVSVIVCMFTLWIKRAVLLLCLFFTLMAASVWFPALSLPSLYCLEIETNIVPTENDYHFLMKTVKEQKNIFCPKQLWRIYSSLVSVYLI